MPARTRIPPTLRFLGGLFALAVLTSFLAGGVMFLQTKSAADRRAEGLTGGSVRAGKLAVAHYGCAGCHAIGTGYGAAGEVGPSLTGIAVRAHIAGKLPNDPKTMIRWLEHPQALSPGSGMPELGVTDRDARDMAAYLYTMS